MHLAAVAVLARFCTASPYLHEEPVPTTTSPDSETRGTEARSLKTLPENQPLVNPNPNPSSQMRGTEAWSLETVSENQPLVNPDPDPSSQMCGTEVQSLETVPENQTLEPNLESPFDPITSNESPDVDMVDTTDLQPSASPAIAGSAGEGAEAIPPRPVPPRPLPLPFSLPLSVQLESMIDRLLTDRLNQATIQVVEPTVKLVVETVIKRMTESAQGASGSCHIEAEESEADEDDDDTPSKRRKKPGKRGQKNYLHVRSSFIILQHYSSLASLRMPFASTWKRKESRSAEKTRCCPSPPHLTQCANSMQPTIIRRLYLTS
jgi:hypothetical protein